MSYLRQCLWAVLGYLLISGSCDAQTLADQKPAADSSATDVASISRHLLDQMQQRGVTFHGQVVNDWSKNLSDGDDPAYGFGRYSLDLSASVESEKSVGWKGGTGFVRLKQHLEEFGWNHDEAAQVYSNIDAASRTTLYELWFEQKWMAGKVRIKSGKIDANSEFAVVESASDFLNSSMGFSPTILAFPTYPQPQPGATVFLSTPRSYGVGLGVFSTAMGSLSIAEPRLRWTVGQNEFPGRFTAGYWRVDGKMDCFDGSTSAVSQGFYGVLEQGVWRGQASSRERSFITFLQFGRASGDVSPFTQHLGGGASWQAPVASRPEDAAGVAATWVNFSSQPVAGFEYGGEFIVEGYYKVSISRHAWLVTDIQFLHHPGGLRAHPDVVVMSPRLVISF